MSQLAWRSWCAGLAAAVLVVGAAPAQTPRPAGSGAAPGPAGGRPPADGDVTVAFINRYFARTWEKAGVEPAPIVSDELFIRRVSLDIIGRIATIEEIEQFFRDPPETRRARLIDRLLAQPEYAEYWASLWTTWLLSRTKARELGSVALSDWLMQQLFRNVSHRRLVEELLTATGKPSHNGAVQFLLAHPGEPLPVADHARAGQFDMVPITVRTTRLFLGIQTQCVQCHDHPVRRDLKQQHFWGANAFFRQMELLSNPDEPGTYYELRDNPKFNQDGVVFYETRSGRERSTPAVFLDGRPLSAADAPSRRHALAHLVTSHELFAKAHVNRLWSHFFGRGLCQLPAADDFGPHNPVLHPELLDRLARDFVDSNYDSRKLIRWITCSRPYHLSVSANATNESEASAVFFSRMALKAMSPEQMSESLQVATGAYGRISLNLNFGDDEGNDAVYRGTIVQALLLMNGRQLNEAIANKHWGRPALARAKDPSPRAVMNELFLASLNRLPTEQEYQAILARLRMRLADRDPSAPWEDLLWALVNSNEFVLNH